MDEDYQRRVARNEALSREVNEAIEQGQWPGEKDSPAAFVCECSRAECNQLLRLTPREYEDIRADARRFIVEPGHEGEGYERVAATEGGYVVVEKRDKAGQLAEASDPRS